MMYVIRVKIQEPSTIWEVRHENEDEAQNLKRKNYTLKNEQILDSKFMEKAVLMHGRTT